MNMREYATGMARYNRWMNEKIYECASRLSDAERRRDRGAFFGSIHGTLSHIYVGDTAWMQRLRGRPVTMKSPRDQPFAQFDDLRAARVRLDGEILDWADTVKDVRFRDPYTFFSVTYQKEITTPGWIPVVQLFNHQTHHRGQVTTLLMQAGIDPGVTDLPMLPDLAAPGAGKAL